MYMYMCMYTYISIRLRILYAPWFVPQASPWACDRPRHHATRPPSPPSCPSCRAAAAWWPSVRKIARVNIVFPSWLRLGLTRGS